MDRYKGAKKTPVAHDVEAMTKGLKAGVTPPSETEGGEKRIWSNEEVSGTMREGGGILLTPLSNIAIFDVCFHSAAKKCTQ